jgi:hypothetical protein
MNLRVVVLLPAAVLLHAQEPDQVTKAIRQFTAAVASNDIDGLVTITRFPIKSNEFGLIRNKAELKRRYREIFPESRKQGLAGQKAVPLLNGIYAVSSKDQSDPIQFLFKKIGTKYLFYSIDNVNE